MTLGGFGGNREIRAASDKDGEPKVGDKCFYKDEQGTLHEGKYEESAIPGVLTCKVF